MPVWRVSAAVSLAALAAAAFLLLLPLGRCQSFGGVGLAPAQVLAPSLWQLNDAVDNVTQSLFPIVKARFGFCVGDAQKDWDRTFNYSGNMDFMENCAATTPDVTGRLCTAAEVRLYFDSFVESGGSTNYMKPNKNCNSSSWVSGCEPGWASSVPDNENVDLRDSERLPSRNLNSKPCCAGFYCPYGITCMIRCFLSSSCDANSEKQNITIFGALVMAALVLWLLIIYNFSDRILSHRERRRAKSRETAAKVAREAAQARERWKAAKNIAVDIQRQISRTISRKRSNKLPVGPASTSEIEEIGVPCHVAQPSELNYSDNAGGHPSEKNPKKNSTKGIHKHTRTQIFKYAYGEIEKEKVQHQERKNLTFSGVISMATKTQARTRPVIEIAFKDLTIVLKTNKKQLLRSVTGKLTPGHVTAIMGPSGAGKTTFLNALAGKLSGCQTTGLVLVNGKVQPIQSYKKIIGFVPQDDIVHGNLTVEENLWFSANCRLSAKMSKADRVLIVERNIESLGLQSIRNSLVGTVEKRGISGGQRKRVNVGLEMVMEPSLLLLDEPTSGLDSSSSLLLMRALRREALEGVNISMVVHQPSYTLFNMFDDLILLAKGGLVAYQGPVKKVEDYFAGLEIKVPDRVNPPDYFIDILEGMVKLNTSWGLKSSQLPVLWMLHNGYTVPPDMQNELNSVAPFRTNSSEDGSVEESVVTDDVWGNVKGALEEKKEHLENIFPKFKDLADRRTPSKLYQYKYYLGRVSKQRLREATAQAVDYLILGLAGVCLGILAKSSNDSNLGAAGYTYTIIAVCQIGALRSFSLEKLQYLRERRSGISSLAYFLARDTVDHFNTVVKPVVYLSMFYFFSAPRSTFADNYIILLALVYCVTGIGYTFAICFQPGSAQLWSALLPVVLTLMATQRRGSQILANICYPKWALEAFLIVNAKRYSGVWLITRCGVLQNFHYDINHFGRCLTVLFLYGFLFRCIAFLCLVLLNKK
ncbi:hypothetical protein ZIOFF_024079 [Zingiber officinale]|uniref:ABC transporter domain-containing protein n=1 Tax=Zingiber officinale TaxID=94328 RepID=A0A8J5GT14_ZINOF|nr:hypothetical protein ZIOFF_024079 [Zingiber officinale]